MADDDELDLDAFIANIEQSAPQAENETDGHRCEECNFILEETDDGSFICPNCSAQATNIQRLEATECFQDETGRNIVGLGVKLSKRKKHEIDYGWAWSTDEAIVHLLKLQIDVLEKIQLVSESTFRQGICNMWLKFWSQNIAPFIKDQYKEGDLIPVDATKVLKYRDIEVLVKVRDKVMIPEKHMIKKRADLRKYEMFNIKFSKQKPLLATNTTRNVSSPSSDENSNPVALSRVVSPVVDENEQAQDHDNQANADSNLQHTPKKRIAELMEDSDCELAASDLISSCPEYGPKEMPSPTKTKNIGVDSISILTLNRTLAFIEATARCLGEPLFASDIIRCCNQRLIPFYGAHKSLPEGMNLNYRDLPMFRKNRPPSPLQLTSAASLLIHKIYRDNFPVLIPVPSFEKMIERLLVDLNLPMDLMNHMDKKITFKSFKQTRPTKFYNRHVTTQLPQYDRWAFVILLCQLKKLFGLNDQSIGDQRRRAKVVARETNNDNCFNLLDWTKQLSIRLQLVTSYDPYTLFHPMTDIKSLQPNPQLYKYIDTVLDDTVTATSVVEISKMRFDSAYRSELSDFFSRHVPKPASLKDRITSEDFLDKPVDFKHPFRDSFLRTKRLWWPTVSKHSRISQLVVKEFTQFQTVLPENISTWSIYDDNCPRNTKFQVQAHWPYCFKLLLSVGAFICYCEPRELLREFRFVEEYLYPELCVWRKRHMMRAPSR